MIRDIYGVDQRFIVTALWKFLILMQTALSIGSEQFSDFRDRYPTPRFLDTKTNVTRSVGEIALLNCSIDNLGTRTVVWRRVDEISPLTVGSFTYVKDHSIIVEHKDGEPDWNLKIINATMEHSGTYECQVSTKQKNFRKYFYLTILERALMPTKELKQEIHLFGPDHVEKGEKLSLSCNATGVDAPPDDLDWFINGYKIVTNFDEGIFMDKTVRLSTKTIASTLHITHTKMEDSGMYTCRTSDLQVLSKNVQILTSNPVREERGKPSIKESQSVTERAEGTNDSSRVKTNVIHLFLWVFLIHFLRRTYIL